MMENKNCGVCRRDIISTGREKKKTAIDVQSPVTFLVNTILNIPTDVLEQLWRDHGKPSTWINCCDVCLELVNKAKIISDSILKMEKRFDKVQQKIKDSIISSEEGELGTPGAVTKRRRNVRSSTEIIRSLVCGQSTQDRNNVAEEVDVQVKVEGTQMPVISSTVNLKFEDSDTNDSDATFIFERIPNFKTENGDIEAEMHPDVSNSSCYLSPDRGIVSSTQNLNEAVVEDQMQNNSSVATVEGSPVRISHSTGSNDSYGILNVDKYYYELKTTSGTSSSVNKSFAAKRGMLNIKEINTSHSDGASKKLKLANAGPSSSKSSLKSSAILSSAPEKFYKCREEGCREGFYRKSSLLGHVKSHKQAQVVRQNLLSANKDEGRKVPPTKKRFPCDICSKVYASKQNLNNHKKKHADITSIDCGPCGMKLSSAATATSLCKHKEMEAFRCQEESCASPLIQSGNVKIHIVRAHSDVQPTHTRSHVKETHIEEHKCETCDKTFGNSKLLKTHSKMHNNEGKAVICDICDRRFAHVNHLNSHQRMSHTVNPSVDVTKKAPGRSWDFREHFEERDGLKRYECKQCKKRLKSFCSLEYHVKTHTGEKPFACDACGKSFRSKYHLNTHNKIHSEGVKCLVCSETFPSKCALIGHKESHNGERRSRKAKAKEPLIFCSLCPQKFKDTNSLNLHLWVHTGSNQIPNFSAPRIHFQARKN